MSKRKQQEIEKYIKKKRRAIQDGKTEVQSSSCIKLAELYTEIGSSKEAIEEYECAATILHDSNKLIEFGTVHRMIGEIYTTQLCDFEKALEHQSIHLNIARKENNLVEEQRALATIGRTHFCAAVIDPNNIKDGLLNKAYSAYAKSLNICENITGISKYELADMKARLLLNIGNIHEQQGNFEKAFKCLETAKKMSKSMDLFETLLIVLNAKSSLYARKKDYKVALQCLNEAYEVADRLSHERSSHLCEILQSKAEIFVKQDDYCSAKNTLMKAYKLKVSDESVQATVERLLKTAAFMYYTEKKLLALHDEDYKEKQLAYEKMGDGACELQNFPKAIFYYQKMLECTEKLNETGAKLSAAYVSLAQTYKDNKEFHMAIQYFHKELIRCSGEAEETVDTLINLAETTYLRGDKFEDIIFYLEQARDEAKSIKSAKLENKVIKQMLHFYEKFEKVDLMKNLKKERSYMNISDDDDDDDDDTSDEDTSGTQDFLNEISISAISDVTDEDDEEIEPDSNTYSIRKRNRVNVKKSRNEKGETPLHIACMKGNYTIAKNLLEQGHPVNERDNSGWTPLHEACNHGHEDVVELLLNHGASINDRGGKHCSGCTPLLDAAGNGHLDIVELLINRGASATMQDDTGRNVLDILIKWHKENIPLNESEECKYKQIVTRLKSVLKSVGWVENESRMSTLDITLTENNQRILRLSGDESNIICSQSSSLMKKPKISPKLSHSLPVKKGRVNRNLIDDDDDDDSFDQPPISSASTEYQKVMNHIRGKIDPKPVSPIKKSTVNALIPEDDNIVDDWLIDDLEQNRVVKRRRISSPELRISKPKPSNNEYQSTRKSISNINSSNTIENQVTRRSTYTASGSNVESRKVQSSLLSSRFSRQLSNDSIESVNQSGFQIMQAETLFNEHVSSSQFLKSLRIDVHIEDTLWIIPIDQTKTHILTIDWLAKEAAKRYYNQEGRLPVLKLLTKEKGILNNDDSLSLVTHFSELFSEIISWNTPSIGNRYVDQCKLLKLGVVQKVFRYLENKKWDSVLNFSHFGLTYKNIVVILQVLRYHERVKEVYFDSNFLRDENLKTFFEYLPTIPQLQKVSFSCNIISWKGIAKISQICSRYKRKVELTEINLSFNTLGNTSIEHLLTVLSSLSLESLRIASCNLNGDLLRNISVLSLNNFQNISTLDISENQIGVSGLHELLNVLNMDILKQLYLASIATEDGNIVSKLVEYFEQKLPSKLELLDLTNCQVTDFELIKLIPLLQQCDQMRDLYLSQNDMLTMISLQHLIGNGTFVHTLKLDLCPKLYNGIRANDELFLNEISLDRKKNKIKVLHTTCPPSEAFAMLTKFWIDLWEENAIIKKYFKSCYHFSVNESVV